MMYYGYINYDEPVFRPPSEAYSLILQATYGCSYNRCRFCLMYRTKRFRIRPLDELFREIDRISYISGEKVKRVFIADGDPLIMKKERILKILDKLYNSFPNLERVTTYAGPKSLEIKTEKDIREIVNAGLTMIYFGIESGSDRVLDMIKKGATSDQMANGLIKARMAGMKVSLTAVVGLGGKKLSEEHARKTAILCNRVQPEYLSLLTLMLPGFEKEYEKEMGSDFMWLDPFDTLMEIKWTVEALELKNTVFRANHASNYLPLKATLSQDKEELLRLLDGVITSRDYSILKPEFLRGL